MIFDTAIPELRKQAIERVKYLLDKKSKIEIIEKNRKRTYKQNNYLHLILSLFALEYGETLEYVKQEFFKKVVNERIFKYEFTNYNTGEVRDAWKSTSKLDTAELTEAISRFRDYAAKHMNLYLPQPNDTAHLEEISNQLEQHSNKIYL